MLPGNAAALNAGRSLQIKEYIITYGAYHIIWNSELQKLQIEKLLSIQNNIRFAIVIIEAFLHYYYFSKLIYQISIFIERNYQNYR